MAAFPARAARGTDLARNSQFTICYYPTQAITRLLTEAVDAGAWGWSTTAIRSHVGFHGKPLSARAASRDELAAYAQVLKKSKRGIIELALMKRFANLDDDKMELLRFLLDQPMTKLPAVDNQP